MLENNHINLFLHQTPTIFFLKKEKKRGNRTVNAIMLAVVSHIVVCYDN